MSLEARLRQTYKRLHRPNAESDESAPLDKGRRDFLVQSLLAGGGLVLGFSGGMGRVEAAANLLEDPTRAFVPNEFLRITPDNVISIVAMHDEMGQGIHTGLAMAVCEELEVDTARVTVESAPSDVRFRHKVFGIQMTGGSTSTSSTFDAMRATGATARVMLLQAAAKTWDVDQSACKAENGFIWHASSGRKLSYGDLAVAASSLPVPAEVALKKPAEFTRIGKPTARVDSASKVRGTALFSLDQHVDGMLTALIERCPYFGGSLTSFDASEARKVRGVKDVVAVPSGVAVIADGYWSAFKARKALKVVWSPGRGGVADSEDLRSQFSDMASRDARVAQSEGNVAASFESGEELRANYELPF
ncbi:MAG: molybdopterin cofactor-binding domain-containing protein, partial [Phycisphaerae bacterium]